MVCVCLYMCDINWNDLLALHAGMYVIYYMHRYATMQRMRVLQIYLSQASHLAELRPSISGNRISRGIFSRKIAVEQCSRKVVWGKGEIILDSVQLASDSRVVWPLGCKSKNNHLNKNTRGQIYSRLRCHFNQNHS